MSIKTRKSKRKLRRWSFAVAYKRVITVNPPEAGEGGMAYTEATPAPEPQTFEIPQGGQLDFVFYGPDKDAQREALKLEELWTERSRSEVNIKDLKVQAIAHETVSTDTIGQINGIKALNDILSKAYELVLEDFTLGKPPASLAIEEAKTKYYERAREILNPQPGSKVILTDAGTIPAGQAAAETQEVITEV